MIPHYCYHIPYASVCVRIIVAEVIGATTTATNDDDRGVQSSNCAIQIVDEQIPYNNRTIQYIGIGKVFVNCAKPPHQPPAPFYLGKSQPRSKAPGSLKVARTFFSPPLCLDAEPKPQEAASVRFLPCWQISGAGERANKSQ